MNDRAGFVAAILDAPTDRTAMGAYADWLDEKGDPLAAAGLRACRRVAIHERPVNERGRRFVVAFDGVGDLVELLAAAHALGVPRPGDAHPLYGLPLSGLAFEFMTRGAVEITASYY